MSEGRALHVDDYGSGPAVVLLHGMPSEPEDFDPLVATLTRSHRVLVPHLPGYGRTPPDPESRSVDDVIARLERWLIDAGIARADLVAFSAGAYKAVATALRARVAVSRLILFAPVVGLDPEVAQGYRDLAAAVRSGAFDARPSWLDRMASPGLAVRDPQTAARVLAWLQAASPSVLCDELDAMADAEDLRPRLRDLACRVLVCAGTADSAVPIAWARDVARGCHHGTLELVEGAGHALLLESPDQVVRLTADFLATPVDAASIPGRT
ncbi:MAG TPA: alpha/beta fold hydrolase [Polyangia bacterium]|nr:alpha/beta fold hydrolase [Polyangia bacterium]